jgi:hypothetical protein
MKGRKRVWSALRKKPLDRPPKGEILITDDFIKKFSGNDSESIVTCISADLVTLPVDKSFLRHQWMYGCKGLPYFWPRAEAFKLNIGLNRLA